MKANHLSAGKQVNIPGEKFFHFLIKKSTIVEIVCSLLIILFLYTGINKLKDLEKFKFEMGRSPFIQDYASLISYFIPIGELILAALLVIRRTRLLGLYLSFTLMGLFSGYIWLMVNYAFDLPCSCGGIISKLSWHDHLIVNLLFTAITLIAIIYQTLILNSNKVNSRKT